MPSLVRLIIWQVVIRKGDLDSIRFYKQTTTEKRKGKISFNPSQNGSRVKVRSSCLHNAWKPTHPQYVFNYFIKFGSERSTRGKGEGGVD